ncbi:hypothetical protein [Lacrimispora defluvii]|uniref:hypothetical protein n=1 Tax=Lacrimispora defluvii TaxID=2719233 RepID=UPI001A9A974B|nr:hypothetical protein [Lacrimispora defluvii]
MVELKTQLPRIFDSFAKARQDGFLAMKKLKEWWWYLKTVPVQNRWTDSAGTGDPLTNLADHYLQIGR